MRIPAGKTLKSKLGGEGQIESFIDDAEGSKFVGFIYTELIKNNILFEGYIIFSKGKIKAAFYDGEEERPGKRSIRYIVDHSLDENCKIEQHSYNYETSSITLEHVLNSRDDWKVDEEDVSLEIKLGKDLGDEYVILDEMKDAIDVEKIDDFLEYIDGIEDIFEEAGDRIGEFEKDKELDKIGGLKKDIEDKSLTIEDHSEEIKERFLGIKEKGDMLIDRIDDLKGILDKEGLSEEDRSAMDVREEHLKELEEKMDRLSLKLENKDQRSNKYEEKLSDMESKIKVLDSIESDLKSKKGSISELEKHLSEREKTMEDIDAELKKQKEELLEKEGSIKEREEKIEERIEELDEREKSLDEKHDELQEKENELQSKEKEIKDKMEKLEDEWDEIEDKREEIKHKSRILAGRKGGLTRKEHLLEEKEESIKELEENKDQE